jgi:hypothetical protein
LDPRRPFELGAKAGGQGTRRAGQGPQRCQDLAGAGLAASAKEGKPISAKYEVEHDQLQLSVYTMKGNGFSEVIVDHKTGKVAKAEPITGGEDLTAAKAQSEAMAKAKRSLCRRPPPKR